jgi:hypothetical protein
MEIKGSLAKLLETNNSNPSVKLTDVLGQKLIRPLPVTQENGGVHLVQFTGIKENERGFRFTCIKDGVEYSINLGINNNPEMFLESIGHLAMQLEIKDAVLSTKMLLDAIAKQPEVYVLVTQRGAYVNYSFNMAAIANALIEAQVEVADTE